MGMPCATPAYAQLMARYARWQNAALIRAADPLGERALQEPRGAFFGSIFATLNHLLWGDRIWMSRFAPGMSPPNRPSIAESIGEEPTWEAYKTARATQDADTCAWADALAAPGTFEGDLSWYSGALGREVSKPKGMVVVHMFNHGTHHRGQVHGMLTAAGAAVDDTDLFILPDPP